MKKNFYILICIFIVFLFSSFNTSNEKIELFYIGFEPQTIQPTRDGGFQIEKLAKIVKQMDTIYFTFNVSSIYSESEFKVDSLISFKRFRFLKNELNNKFGIVAEKNVDFIYYDSEYYKGEVRDVFLNSGLTINILKKKKHEKK